QPRHLPSFPTRRSSDLKVRLFGDLVLAAFFEGETSKEREKKRTDYASEILSGEAERYRGWLEEWRHAERPLSPFHWEIEFPEVLDRKSTRLNSSHDQIS